jgi:hypothetical protein
VSNFRAWNQWIDAQGNQRLSRYDCGDSLSSGVVRAAVQAVSNAGLLAVTAANTGGPYVLPPTSGDYLSVYDYAELWFLDNVGDQFTFVLPAPYDTLFQSDTITWGTGVLPTSVAGVLIASLVNPSNGAGVQAFYGGTRKRKRV